MSTNLALKLASQSLAVQLAALDSDLRSDRRKNLFGVSHESPRFGNCRIDPDPEVVVFEHFGHGTHLTGFGEMAAERAGSSGKLALTLRPFRTQGQLNPGGRITPSVAAVPRFRDVRMNQADLRRLDFPMKWCYMLWRSVRIIFRDIPDVTTALAAKVINVRSFAETV
jgi:hypothetical protein